MPLEIIVEFQKLKIDAGILSKVKATKATIQKYGLRGFCGRHGELCIVEDGEIKLTHSLTHSKDDGAGEVHLQRSLSDDEGTEQLSGSVQKLLEFIDSHGGSVSGNEISQFFLKYPDAKATMGKVKEICERYHHLKFVRLEDDNWLEKPSWFFC